jgi:hypothetical protein
VYQAGLGLTRSPHYWYIFYEKTLKAVWKKNREVNRLNPRLGSPTLSAIFNRTGPLDVKVQRAIFFASTSAWFDLRFGPAEDHNVEVFLADRDRKPLVALTSSFPPDCPDSENSPFHIPEQTPVFLRPRKTGVCSFRGKLTDYCLIMG